MTKACIQEEARSFLQPLQKLHIDQEHLLPTNYLLTIHHNFLTSFHIILTL